MMFVVTNYPMNRVDVRLDSDAKQKIKKIAYYSVTIPCAVYLAVSIVQERRNKNSE